MKTLSILALLFLFLGIYGQDYFPLAIGNVWVYEACRDADSSFLYYDTLEITDTVNINNKVYFRLKTGSIWPSYYNLIRMDSANQLVVYDSTNDSVKILYKYSSSIGDTNYHITNRSTSFTVLASASEYIKLSFGIYSNCLLFYSETINMTDSDVWDWFSRELGLIKKSQFLFYKTLKYAKINGIEYSIIDKTPISFLRNYANYNIFPNPINNKVFISNYRSSSITRIEIYSCNGEKRLSNEIKLNNKDISIELGNDLPSGVYLLKIINREGSFYHKISIQK